MQIWKKPTITKYEKNMITKTITAKAYTIGQAMSVGELCAQGIGASNIVLLPNGMTEYAYVAAWNQIEDLFTLIINGVKRIFSCKTGVLS